MFNIFFSSHEPISDGEVETVSTFRGKIYIEDFNENFRSSTIDWRPSDYETHWKKSAERIVSGHDNSAFVTSFSSPQYSKFLVWWPAYRFNNKVIIHNQLLFFNQLKLQFNPENIYEHIHSYRNTNDEGDIISSWETTVEAFRAYLSKRTLSTI